jgi:drug/metabolite transporter (DMT)-like permease
MAASAVAYSTAGLFTRLVDLDIWTVLFWRGMFAGLFVAAFVLWQSGRGVVAAIRAIGTNGLWIAALSAAATIFFLNALRLTSVAEVAVINATSPLVTGVLARLFIGERGHWTTLAASLVALVGIAVMFNPTVSTGHLTGNLLAVAMTLCLAGMLVMLRGNRNVSMLPATGLSAFLCAFAVWPFANPGTAHGMNLIYLVLFGTFQFGLGLLLLTLGSRLVSATRSSLISRLQLPLAPVWVWLAFGEVPSRATCVGGLIVAAAVLGEMLIKPPEPGAGSAPLRPAWWRSRCRRIPRPAR